MKKQLLSITAFCAALLVIGAQAQSSSDPNSTSGTSGSSGSSSSSTPGSSYRHQYGATGRMGHQELRASQLMGANVTGSSGETLGTISDTIINPASGRIDFAVLSLSSSGGAGSSGSSTSPSGSSSGSSSSQGSSSSSLGSPSSSSGGSSSPSGSASGSSGSSLSSAGGKQVAVPWMLLRPSSASSSSSSSTSSGSTSGQQTSFVFSGDSSKLQSAPNFDPNTDLTQPGWRQSIFSYFGLSGSGSATGAAETPGGSGSSSSGGSSSPGSSSSGSDSSSGSSSSGSSGASGK